MESKPRKKATKKGGKRKGKKIARGAKKLFETDILSQRRRPAPPQQQQQQPPIFNLNISQQLRNIVGAFSSASASTNYAKTQEINRQAAEASARAETIVGLNRENFLQTLEKQRLERKVERGERAYAGAVAQSDRKLQQLGNEMFRIMSGTGKVRQRSNIDRSPRVMEIVSMTDSDAVYQGFDDMPPERRLSSQKAQFAHIMPSGKIMEGAQMPGDNYGAQDDDSFGGGGAAAGGGGAFASEQYVENQPRGRPIIRDPASRRTERPKRRPKINIPTDLLPESSGETSAAEMPKRASTPPAASATQKLKAADIRQQISAATGVPQKSIKFATGKGSRKAIGGVDWVTAISDVKRQGLSGASAIEFLKQKYSGTLN